MTDICTWYFESISPRGATPCKTIEQVHAHLAAQWTTPGLVEQTMRVHNVSRVEAERRLQMTLRGKGYGLFSGWDKEIFEWRKRDYTGDMPEEDVKNNWLAWVRATYTKFIPNIPSGIFEKNPEWINNYHLFITTPEQQKRYNEFKSSYGITGDHLFSESDGYSINRNVDSFNPRLKWELLKFTDADLERWKTQDSASNKLRDDIEQHIAKLGA